MQRTEKRIHIPKPKKKIRYNFYAVRRVTCNSTNPKGFVIAAAI